MRFSFNYNKTMEKEEESEMQKRGRLKKEEKGGWLVLKLAQIQFSNTTLVEHYSM
jgi:hypothetical protein